MEKEFGGPWNTHFYSTVAESSLGVSVKPLKADQEAVRVNFFTRQNEDEQVLLSETGNMGDHLLYACNYEKLIHKLIMKDNVTSF